MRYLLRSLAVLASLFLTSVAVAQSGNTEPQLAVVPVTAPASINEQRPDKETVSTAPDFANTASAEPASAIVEKSKLDAVAHMKPVLITGRVTNEQNLPMAGVTVSLKGSAALTITDAEGKYTLQAPAGTNAILYSYGGYQDKELFASNFLPVVVSLMPTSTTKEKNRGKRDR
ncbi:carboxypeptidase-like regulatory domain-containing protein [Hymenobacter sp. BT491]|uniref:carboxypeptidase-like regulatory domain-containing protein n=1 Tax=Hymenobacter sp. BT491 TaxID=2766779 RepID=UPI001653AEF6|nr:carboxypeptidase-like regulatory domain-containing protein [Hymenobacter sp. BT491]MBC6989164.1 carboxypeptidase-like regulatory domain-containing protein [Hymenobacter sp. BT491]